MPMNKIAAFIDFTEGCKIALSQAAVIANKTGADMYVVYVMIHGGDAAETEKQMRDFSASVPGLPDNIKYTTGSGELLEGAAKVLRQINPDLVVVGTHGIKGIVQHLFGAHILKLVQAIPFPCIVVQENTVVKPDGFRKVLFPVGSHPRYDIKIAQTAEVAGIFGSEIIQYEIDKSIGIDEIVKKNSDTSRDFFENHPLNFSFVMEDANVVSVGFSRQTLKYAAEHGCDLISQMSDVPANEVIFGKADKENFLTNEHGIPVLCCNE